jgi:hypothetical protein
VQEFELEPLRAGLSSQVAENESTRFLFAFRENFSAEKVSAGMTHPAHSLGLFITRFHRQRSRLTGSDGWRRNQVIN